MNITPAILSAALLFAACAAEPPPPAPPPALSDYARCEQRVTREHAVSGSKMRLSSYIALYCGRPGVNR